MQFNEYLRSCREHNQLTQEQLVHDLYSHDIDSFKGLDTSTLSKWERGVTKPKASKQVSIIKYFQNKTGAVLPCWDHYSIDETEELICKAGMRNLIGKSQKHIYDFPSETMSVDDIHVYPLRSFERMDDLIELNMPLHKSLNHESLQVSQEQFKEWALHPDSLFLACEYKGSFIGLSFTTKVKPEIFDKILNFEMKRSEMNTDDFASFDEIGSSLFLGFFALNEKAAVLLFIRYYAYLIANQNYIADIGGVVNSEEAIKLVSNMNLQYHGNEITDDDITIKAYRQTLSNALASEHVVKMILSNQECPEE
jgi:transcriptional regulator with XRE-family HTH domain